MNLRFPSKLTLVWLLIGIPLLSYFILKKTFNLALYGDDWLQLYNLWLSFDVHKTMSFFDIRSYLGAYWPQYFFLGVIRHFFGYQAQAYFAASLFLRILATTSLFFTVKEFSKNNLASFLATLIFIFSTAGLQTTDWVFNMNTYAGLFLFNLAIVYYLKLRTTKTFISWLYIAFIVCFTLALGVVPVRMHGAVPFLIISELFIFLAIERNSILRIDRFFLSRLILPITILFLLMKVGSFGSSGDNLPLLSTSFQYLTDMLQRNRFDVLFYFFGMIGNIAIPDIANITLSNHLITTGILFTVLEIFIFFVLQSKNIFYKIIIGFNFFWIITTKMITIWNPTIPASIMFAISLGFHISFLSVLIYFQAVKKYPKLALSVVVGLIWIVSFTLLYWLRTGFQIIESTGRYMTLGSVGFSILFASILSLMFQNYISLKTGFKKNLFFTIPSFVLLIWMIINLSATNLYLTSLETNRNLFLANKIWGTLQKNVPKLDENAPSVFFFTYDNPTTAYMILTFGFWPHAGLLYNVTNWENTPLPTDSYPELLEMVRTGEPVKRVHARKEIPIPLSRVFAFELKNNELIPITEQVRAQLAKDLR